MSFLFFFLVDKITEKLFKVKKEKITELPTLL